MRNRGLVHLNLTSVAIGFLIGYAYTTMPIETQNALLKAIDYKLNEVTRKKRDKTGRSK